MNSVWATTANNGVEVGKEGGAAVLADKVGFQDCVVAEYVWLDSNGETRSKCKTMSAKPANSDDCAIWSYNGTPCGQATPESSDVYLVPRKVFDDPVRGHPHVLVVCESITAAMEPAEGNWRAVCMEMCDQYAAADCWFGAEQEYTCCDRDGVPLKCAGTDFYCGRGAMNIPAGMRAMMGDHYAMCMRAGIKICGMNMESGMAQGEYQIGPCKAINIGDHVIAARHTLHKSANKYNMSIDFSGKSANGNKNGMHMNISTRQTRGDGGLTVIEKIARGLGRRAKDAIPNYGKGNEERLDGKDDCPQMEFFKFGVADRTGSCRVPRTVGIVGKGWLEDRRPAANADPYRVAGHMIKTAGEISQTNYQVLAKSVNKY